MRLRLIKLRCSYFKGLREFVFEPNGNDADIYGDNSTGKSTIADMEHWLFFGKDSLNRSVKAPGKAGFEIKTLDASGSHLHNLEHEVEGVYDIGGKIVTLRRVYKETWTKKRGQPKSEFTGHTTDYYIDGVPMATEKEYTAFISSILNENIFKLLTNPLFFSEQLKMEDRRKILVKIGGDIQDADVIKSNKALKELPDILQGRTVEDHKKVINARRSKINDELKTIPIRISEVQRGLPDISGIDSKSLDTDIALKVAQVQGKEQDVAKLESGGAIAEKTKLLREAEAELIRLANEHQQAVDKKVEGRRAELNQIRNQLNDARADESGLRLQKINLQKEIQSLRDKRTALADEWKRTDSQEFIMEQDHVCPACGQALPTERIQAARNNALAQFNQTRSEALERINIQGEEIRGQIKEKNQTLKDLEVNLQDAESNIKTLQDTESDIKLDIESLINSMGQPADMPEYSAKVTEKQRIQEEIQTLREGAQTAFDDAQKELDALNSDLTSLKRSKLQLEQAEQGQKRIEELEKQEKDLSAEYEKLEKELSLIDQFTKAQAALMESKINSKFKLARFKMFETQVNGGIVDCCETLYNGVPFSAGLNTGHRNAVGMDIINTLSEHFNFYPPVFVDNAESVTVLPPMRAQVIRLIVSEPDKALRVEIKNDKGGTLFE